MIYLFFGEDQYSLFEEVKKLKADNVPPDAEDFNFCKLDALKSGFVLDDVLNNCEAFPFLSDKKLVVVSGLIGKLGKGAASEEKKAAKRKTGSTTTSPREKFLDFIPRMPTTTILVLLEEKAAKNDVIYKAIDKHGAVRDFVSPRDWALEKWINERAVLLDIKLERTVAPLLREYVGSDLYRLHNELQKLAAYAGDGQSITPKMVEMLTPEMQEVKVWDLTDALAKCDLASALRQLNLQRNETTLAQSGFNRQIFNIICKQIYDLLRIKEMHANRKSAKEIADQMGMHPYRLEKMLPLVRNFQGDRLERLYTRLTELDFADKTGKADLATELDLLVAEICQK